MSQQKEVEFTGGFRKEIFSTLAMAYGPYKLPLIFALMLGFVGRLFLLANANVIGIWVDQFCKPSLEHICRPQPAFFANFTSQNFLALLLALTTVGFLFTAIYRIWFSILSAKAVSTLYDEVTLRTSRFPMSFFDNNPVGRVVTRFSSDYGTVFRLFGGPLAEFFAIIFDLVIFVLLISIASPNYIPVLLVTVAANYGLYRFNRNSLRSLRRDVSRNRSPSISHFAETTQGASTIRSFMREKSFSDRFKALDQSLIKDKGQLVKKIILFSAQMNVLTALLFLSVGLTALASFNSGAISVGDVGAAFGLVVLSGFTVQMFFDWMTQFEEALVGIERLDQYLRSPIEPQSSLPSSTKYKTAHSRRSPADDKALSDSFKNQPTSAEVEFKNVSFRYSQNLPLILDDVSFKIPAGEHWGLVGKTGSGKSTITQILARLYPLQSGEISIGINTSQETSNEIFRQSFSLVSQDPVLFTGSLRNNLSASPFSDEQLLAILELVGLSRFSQASDLEFMIEEKGKNISQGEKQLISLARGLLQNTPFVVLDEATASVDPQTEEIMTQASEKLFQARTQLIIAHRLSTLEKCHKVIWLENGKIKRIDTPKVILALYSHEGV